LILLMSGLLSVLAVQQVAAQATLGSVINATYLNVRTAPGTTAGVVAVIRSGYAYPVLGRNADSTWWLVSLSPSNHVTGWASGTYLTVTNAHLVPFVTPPAPTAATISMGTVSAYFLNVRAIPDPVYGSIIAKIARAEVYQVIGRNSISSWWQISLPGGQTGWVNGDYLNVTNTHLVPITDTSTPVVTASGTVVNAYYLNVRTTPNPYIANVVTIIGRFQTYRVIGRNSTSTWWQIDAGNGLTGWVSGRYFSVINGHVVPITG
jgi:uncharacterized protein YgiM (DUF1202 family)